jgi:type I restriction enzyme S subunit
MTDSGYPVFGANGRIGYYTEYNHEHPTVLITCRGATCGTINVCDPKSYVTGNAMALDELDPQMADRRFVAYALNWRGLRDAITGSAQPQITRTSLSGVEIPLPPLSEQKRIADILDKADTIRRKRQDVQATSRTIYKAAFYHSFGRDFLNRGDTVTLESLIDQRRGISYGVVQRGTHNPSGIPVARISNIVRNEFDDSDFVCVDPDISGQYNRSILEGGEILISIRGTVGRAAIAPERAAGWNVTREVAVIPLLEDVSQHFIHQLILTDEAQRFIAGNVRGVAQRGINLRDLRMLPVPSPKSSEVAAFVQHIRKVDDLVTRTSECVAESHTLFDSIVQRAFRGEL